MGASSERRQVPCSNGGARALECRNLEMKLTEEIRARLKQTLTSHEEATAPGLEALLDEFKYWLNEEQRKELEPNLKVVVLSAPHETRNVCGWQVVNEYTEENKLRIEAACELLGGEGCDSMLILSGEKEQLPMMVDRAAENLKRLGVKRHCERIRTVDSGPRGQSNTKTQFETLRQSDYWDADDRLVIVSTDYHGPRVLRTAHKVLEMEKVLFSRVQKFEYDVEQKVRREIEKIFEYAKKGHISSTLDDAYGKSLPEE